MSNQLSFSVKVFDWIMRYSIFALMFLMPIFFLPWTSEVLDFNKQTLMVALVFISFFCWMIKVLITGKFEINLNKIHIIVAVFLLLSLLSTIFSIYRNGSFWGWPQSTAGSLLTLLCLSILYFLISNIFSKKDIYISIIAFFISAFVAQIIGILQLFNIFIFPFNFAKTTSFNTVGTVGSLGFLLAILLPLTIILTIFLKKWLKVLFGVILALSIFLFLIIDYPIIWWAVVAGSAIIIIFMILMRNMFDGRWMSLPVFFLAISLFFIFLNPQIPGISQKANEIFLSQSTTLKIAWETIKEMPIFGSGIGTFAYDFARFKEENYSQSSLWNITFNRGSSEILNILATMGVLGFLAFLSLMVSTIIFSFKFLITKKNTKIQTGTEYKDYLNRILLLGFLGSFTVGCIVYFIYNSNIVLSVLFFFLLGSLISLTTKEKYLYELKPSSLTTLIITFIFTSAFIFGFGLLILDAQRYIAEVKYYNGLVKINANNLDEGTKQIESAVAINPSSDLYFRQLSQIYLLKLQNRISEIKSDILNDEEKREIQSLLANTVNAGKIATNLNPKNSSNWSSMAYIYQNLYGFLTDADDQTLSSYDEAIKLDPNNPYLYAQKGYANFISAYNLTSEQNNQKKELLNNAKNQLEKALQLNSNYSNAMYYLGLVYNAMGEKQKAIEEFTKVQQLNPDNKDIPKIIEALKSGRAAQLSTESVPDQEHPDGTFSENTVKNPPESKSESDSNMKE